MTENETILGAIKAAVHKVEPDAELVLFGSRARGDEHSESDWDILILSDRIVTWQYKNEITDSLFFVGLEFGIAINSLIVNRKEWGTNFQYWPIHTEIEKDGVML